MFSVKLFANNSRAKRRASHGFFPSNESNEKRFSPTIGTDFSLASDDFSPSLEYVGMDFSPTIGHANTDFSPSILVGGFICFIYLVVVTIFTVIQGQGTVVSEDVTQVPDNFTEFQGFSYKTVDGEQWYDFPHPYIFPTLGVLTQGVILDSSAVVGLRHIAWDIADRNHSVTEVRAFADGTVAAVKDNTLYNTTRRWKFCDESDNGICWYEVAEPGDVQYGCGNEVDIQHTDSLRSQYCHLASVNVQVYDEYGHVNHVTMGQMIGIQGSTGWATGKHLHFAIWRGGQPIPPSYAFTQTSLSDWGDDGN